MSDAVGLVKAMKKAAVEAMNAERPVEVCFGKVLSTSPLQICVEQKLTLGKAQLILTRNVTEYRTYMEIGNIRAFYNAGALLDESSVDMGCKDAVGKVEVTVYNGLAAGDEVILLRQQGGQKYIVWDRIS